MPPPELRLNCELFTPLLDAAIVSEPHIEWLPVDIFSTVPFCTVTLNGTPLVAAVGMVLVDDHSLYCTYKALSTLYTSVDADP